MQLTVDLSSQEDMENCVSFLTARLKRPTKEKLKKEVKREDGDKIPEVTVDDVKKALREYDKDKGREATMAILRKYTKSGKVADLTPEDRVRLMGEIDAR